MLKLSRRNIIESTSSSSDSDHYNYDLMKLIDNKNDLIKISAISRVRKYLKYYEDNPMSNNDKELLAGIFVR